MSVPGSKRDIEGLRITTVKQYHYQRPIMQEDIDEILGSIWTHERLEAKSLILEGGWEVTPIRLPSGRFGLAIRRSS